MVRLISTLLVLWGVSAQAVSQEARDATATKRSGPVALDKKQERVKLDKFRNNVAAKMVPRKVEKKGERQVRAWLDRFQVVQSEHYLVYTNGPKATSRKFAKTLEQLYSFMQERFPFEDLSRHLECYVFKTKEQYFDFCVRLRGWSREQAEGTAGHATAAYYAAYYQSPKSATVMHEAAHQVVMACLGVPGVGSWFQEGFAVYVEKKILNQRIPGSIKADLRSGRFYALRDMVGIRRLLSDRHGLRNYDHAGTILAFLIESKAEPFRGRFPEFLAASRRSFRRGEEVAEKLFERVYGLTIEEVEAAWMKHYGAAKSKSEQRPSRSKSG